MRSNLVALCLCLLAAISTPALSAATELESTLKRLGPVDEWSPATAADFLSAMGFHDSTVRSIRSHKVNGALLLELEATDWFELGVTNTLEMKRWKVIRNQIKQSLPQYISKPRARIQQPNKIKAVASDGDIAPSRKAVGFRELWHGNPAGVVAWLCALALSPEAMPLLLHLLYGGNNALDFFGPSRPQFSWTAWLLGPNIMAARQLFSFWGTDPLCALILSGSTVAHCMNDDGTLRWYPTLVFTALDAWYGRWAKVMTRAKTTARSTFLSLMVTGTVFSAVYIAVCAILWIPWVGSMTAYVAFYCVALLNVILGLVSLYVARYKWLSVKALWDSIRIVQVDFRASPAASAAAADEPVDTAADPAADEPGAP